MTNFFFNLTSTSPRSATLRQRKHKPSAQPCDKFEPQFWRKSKCKTCFLSAEKHSDAARLASSSSSGRKRAGSVARTNGPDASLNGSPASKSDKNVKSPIATREGRSNTVSERPSLGSAVADSFLSGSSSSHRQQIVRSTSTWSASRDNSLLSRPADSDTKSNKARNEAKAKASVDLVAEVKVQGSPSPRIAEKAANYLKNASSASLALGSRSAVRDGRAQTVCYGNLIPMAEIEDDFFPPTKGPRRTNPAVCLDFDEVVSVFGNLDNIKRKSSSRKSIQRSSSTAPSKRSSIKRSSSRRTTTTEVAAEDPLSSSPKKSTTRSRANSISVSDLSLTPATSVLPPLVEITQTEEPLKSSKRNSSKRSSEKRKLKSSHSVSDLISSPTEPAKAPVDTADVLSLLKSRPIAEQVEISSPEKKSKRSSEKRLRADSERSEHKSRRRSATITDTRSSTSSSGNSPTPSTTLTRSPKKKQSKMIVLTADVPSVKDLTSSEASEESSPPTPHSSRQSASSEAELQPMSRSVSVSPRPPEQPRPVQTPEETPDAIISGLQSRLPQTRPSLAPISFETIAGLIASAGENGLVSSN